MAMGKSFRVYERDNSTNPYSILIEHRNKDTSLVLESDIVAVLSTQEKESIKKQYTKVLDGYGILGVLKFQLGENRFQFLVIVTGCISLGKIGDSEVFRITQTAFLSLRKQPQDEDQISEIRKLLNSGTFYFSWLTSGEALDITLCAQRKEKTSATDNRFFWNRTMLLHFMRFGVDCNQWLLKAMCGSVEIRTVYVGPRQGKAVIISRLSCERTGTRFHVRGVNDYGYVANFVETEQAIYMENSVSSYIQIRGSVPLFWEQTGVQVGQHRVKMSRSPECSSAAFDRHISNIKQRYGHQTIVNLLSTSLTSNKESETMLSNMFQEHHKQSQHGDVAHIVFDYHQECRGGNQKNLAKLKAQVDTYLQAYSVFVSKGSEVLSWQNGTIRTNCLDCLDRTNCVQTFFGLQMLTKQLEFLDLDKQQSVARFEEVFKQMWVDNGNEVSKMYAGTGAIQGGSKIMDGARSAARTIQNNLLDSSKQEAIDVLLLGNMLDHSMADIARTLLEPKMVYFPPNIVGEMCDRILDYTVPKPLRVAVGTYNVNGGKHFRSVVYKDVSLTDWLLDAHINGGKGDNTAVDIFAIGFEEIVDLSASNIMAASSDNAKAWAEELQKVLSRDREYVMLTYVQLVGVCLFVFIRQELIPHLRDIATDSVKTGLGGATGNKGGVAIRFVLYNTSLCFMCSHFAAGQSQVNERNSDYNEITKKVTFPLGAGLAPQDYIFWCGDFNYRIDMDKEELKEYIKMNQLTYIMQYDQLRVQQDAGNIFTDYIEGDINFNPTYKYDLFSDDYDTSEKCRAPAWTDRILWKRRNFQEDTPANPGQLIYYGKADLKQSDHRPVIALIDIEVLQVDPEQRERVFKEIVKKKGPLDGTVLIEEVGGNEALLEENNKIRVLEYMAQFGEVILVRQVEDSMSVMYRDSETALAAANTPQVNIDDTTYKLYLKTQDWEEMARREMELCGNNTIPLCEYRSISEHFLNRPSPSHAPGSGRSSPSAPPSRPPLPKINKPKVGVMSMPQIPKRPDAITNSPKKKINVEPKPPSVEDDDEGPPAPQVGVMSMPQVPKRPETMPNSPKKKVFEPKASIDDDDESRPAPQGLPPPPPVSAAVASASPLSPPPVPPRTSGPPPLPARPK